MTTSARKVLTIAAGTTGVVLVLAAYFLWTGRRQYDPAFDAHVADPTYKDNGPLVLYDEGHLNTHAANDADKPFADLTQSDGYQLRVSREQFSEQALAGAAILVVVLARGTNDANDLPAFSQTELAAVDHWVRNGGSLLLITDHWPYGAAAAALAGRFGIECGRGFVEDPKHHDADRGESHLVFSADNGLLADHPIIRGRQSSEVIKRVLTFTGQSVLGPPAAVAFLRLSDVSTERPPTAPKVERMGSDVRVNMEYGAPVSAKGRAQGVALEVEKGRVVVLGEAGMLRAQRERGGRLVGMNVPGYDNRQLALNIMHWLSRAL